MTKSCFIVFVATIIAFSNCKKEETIPVYETGQGHITGQADNGINFDIEGKRAYFTIYRAAPNMFTGEKDNLLIYAHIDTIISRHFSILLATYENKVRKYYLDEQDGQNISGVNFITQGNPQVSYYFYYATGLRPYVNITRVTGTYIEGDYFVRVSLAGSYNGPFITVQGTFKGNCRVLQ